MNCENIKKIIPRYISHNASNDEINMVEEHLCICDKCRTLLADSMDSPQPTVFNEPDNKDLKKDEISGLLEYLLLGISLLILLYFLFSSVLS
ncbi:MAG: zf-HC2 domain-containing protein [Candidatus Omnitrophica bacterium]|jgi:predicted anti-sigma-YlaC factor YlaD|nr:zf-HC2 domain-containing protein [Candidatus Omnitrophota bacterium]MDD5080951.1 zf-HC2 domain-containing protein [Candidatus Omnitrophota bacterium]MDD5440594.1 zf-HC2 domain-containing protein [Candidatus Omnitrophota bacterium]